VLAGVLVLGAAATAVADADVFFAPGLVQVNPGQEFEMGFRVAACDDSICLTQLYMSFDHTLVELVEASEGSLYANINPNFWTWSVLEEEEPGLWHLASTTFPAGSYIVPPGELFHLRFGVLPGASGYTPVHVVSVALTDVRRDPLPVTSAMDGHILIGDTDVEFDLPAASLGPAAPNPFVGATSIAFSVPDATEVWSVDIYDLNGRLVRRLEVPSGSRTGSVAWDGRTRSGAAASSGVYFVRLSGGGGSAQTRIVKLN
jgi:hypothetical protein